MTDAKIKKLLAEQLAMRIFEERSKAFRIIYDTVFEIEGITEKNIYNVICSNLRKICNAKCAALALYIPDSK